MKRNLTMFLILGAAGAAGGCAADATGADDGGGDGPGTMTPEPVPSSPAGKFSVQSNFDLATNMPGTAGVVINTFISATDDPDDPTKFIVDKLIGALPEGSIKNFVRDSAPFVTGYLNDRLLDVAPEFVGSLVSVGDKFGQIAHNFGTIEVLDIAANGSATKLVTGLHFKVDGVEMDFPFADYGMADVKVAGLQVTLDKLGKLAISKHNVPLKYGALLKVALDQAIIPLIDPSAANLQEVLSNVVDCYWVGEYVYEALSFGSPSTYENACNSGLRAAANLVYDQISQIDAADLEFGMAGAARGVDRNRDSKMDTIQTGVWSGTLSYGGTPAPLATAKFFGTKM